MDYVFGNISANGVTHETVKTVGETHTDLSGYVQTVRDYPDQVITDNFRVVERMYTDEDCEGNCYDWYIIDSHYRYVDKTAPVKTEAARNAANIDYLSMMSGIDLPDEEDDEETAEEVTGDE